MEKEDEVCMSSGSDAEKDLSNLVPRQLLSRDKNIPNTNDNINISNVGGLLLGRVAIHNSSGDAKIARRP